MSFWITVHYPHPASAEDDVPWNVYLDTDNKRRGEPLQVGDRILFYETDDRPSFEMVRRGHAPKIVKRRKGRMSIVREGVIKEALREARNPFQERRKDRIDSYDFEVRCDSRELTRPIPYKVLCGILGKKTFRPNAGLRQISAEKYRQLLAATS